MHEKREKKPEGIALDSRGKDCGQMTAGPGSVGARETARERIWSTLAITGTQAEERRLAIVDGQKLMDFETEIEGREQRKGNIYKAVVTRDRKSVV